MTLAELVPAAKELSPGDKVKLIRILAEELDSNGDTSPLVPHEVYHIYTPYDSFDAAQAVYDALELAKKEQP